jgi:hypothetical protein
LDLILKFSAKDSNTFIGKILGKGILILFYEASHRKNKKFWEELIA